MAMKPGAFLRQRLGDMTTITVLGKTVNLEDEVSIPDDDDLEQTMAEHVEREAAWRMILAQAKAAKRVADDDLKEMEGLRFSQIYQELYDAERKEYDSYLHDEGESTDPFKRRRRADDRLAMGPTFGRFRPSFTDDRVQALVKFEAKIVTQRQKVRHCANEVDVVMGVVETMEVRARALSHLCALHRDVRHR